MLEKIKEFADIHNMFPRSGRVVVCVSGGADSMCLLRALTDISATYGFSVVAVHYNHMLRGAESDRDESFVRDYCGIRGVPVCCGTGDVKAYAARTGMNIEKAARELRYDFFYKAAEEYGAGRIATAHTANDNAETMLINLARGAGTRGLSGIPPKRAGKAAEIEVIRPMLRVTRDEVLCFLAENSVPFNEDSTNRLDIYTRNKIRHSVIPVMREINPKFLDNTLTAAALLRADEEYLGGLADEFIVNLCDGRSIPIKDINELPICVSGRVVRKQYGGSLSHEHVKAVLDLCKKSDPSASVSLPGAAVFREYDRIVFADSGLKQGGITPIYPAAGDCAVIEGTGLKFACHAVICRDIISACANIDKSFTSFLFKTDEICGRLTVRQRQKGDSVRLTGRNGTRTLKKLFIERRIPVRMRELIPVISDDRGVLAVYGVGRGDRAVPGCGDKATVLEFTVCEADKVVK